MEELSKRLLNWLVCKTSDEQNKQIHTNKTSEIKFFSQFFLEINTLKNVYYIMNLWLVNFSLKYKLDKKYAVSLWDTFGFLHLVIKNAPVPTMGQAQVGALETQ